jgi:hypothetical protein
MPGRRTMPYGIPSALSVADAHTRATLEAIIANLQVAFGVSGEREQWMVSRDDLVGSSTHTHDDLGRLAGRAAGTATVEAGGGNTATVISPSGNITIGIEVSVAGDVATIAVQVAPAGVYVIKAWLSDDADGALTATTPNVSGVREWQVITAVDGTHTFTVEDTGSRTWYFRAAPLGIPTGTEAVTL